MLQKNLQVIDQAIAESREADAGKPAPGFDPSKFADEAAQDPEHVVIQ